MGSVLCEGCGLVSLVEEEVSGGERRRERLRVGVLAGLRS
eukprot:COSAG05_NODE_11830_length_494_cov_0.800000_1_plen_39_part_01